VVVGGGGAVVVVVGSGGGGVFLFVCLSNQRFAMLGPEYATASMI